MFYSAGSILYYRINYSEIIEGSYSYWYIQIFIERKAITAEPEQAWLQKPSEFHAKQQIRADVLELRGP